MIDHYESLKKEKISLAYLGAFNDEITSILIDLSEVYMSKVKHLAKLSRKTNFLIAESFQNLIRHGVVEKEATQEVKYNRDFYHIKILDDCIVITSANVFESINAPELANKIEHINSLNSDELQHLRKDILEHGAFSAKGGIGLGLIEMVRKTKLPLKQLITPLSEKYSLLLLGLMLPLSKEETENKIDIENVGKFYRTLVDEGTRLLYKGDFSSQSNTNIIDILHNNFEKNGQLDASKLKNIVTIIEVIQNVSKHGKKVNGYTEGIFALKEIDNELFIECSNLVDKEGCLKLKSVLSKIKASTMEEIEKEYKQKMVESYLSDDDNTGLGLLEIARFTQNKFTYRFEETSENEMFFSLKIKTV